MSEINNIDLYHVWLDTKNVQNQSQNNEVLAVKSESQETQTAENTPATKAECEAMKSTHGVLGCYYDGSDYWAGAVKQCGHASKLPSKTELEAIADYVYNASGNVNVWYQDYYAVGPKITFIPDEKTGKPNEIFFTGRSSITQGVKTIYADKIRMTIEPKDFQAEGNVRTIIRNIDTKEEDL